MAQLAEVPGGQFTDPVQDGAMVGHVAPGEVILDSQRIDPPLQFRQGQQPLELGRESQRPVGQFGRKERLHPEAVAREKQPLLAVIVKREGEHPVEPFEAVRPPCLPGREDGFGIAFGGEACAFFRQFGAQFAEIVYFPIEDDRRSPVRAVHRLGRSGEVDDR